jgi:hypothetical protein
VLANPQTVWDTVTVTNWYGRGPTQVEITSAPAVPIRWVLVRDPHGKFEAKALLCTDPTAQLLDNLAWLLKVD